MNAEDVAIAARVVLALVFFVSGTGKLVTLYVERRRLREVAGKTALGVGTSVALPVVELTVAALLGACDAVWPVYAALGLLAVFTAVVLDRLARHDQRPCNCFGPASTKTALASGALVRNGWFLAVAVVATGVSSIRDPDHTAVTILVGLALAGVSGVLIART